MKQVNTLDKYLTPINSGMSQGSIPPHKVPWEFGVSQGIQSKKIRSSSGYFKHLSAGTIGTATYNNAIITASLFNGGSVTNASIQGGTMPNAYITGGTINNTTFGTPSMTGGTFNNNVLGTPSVNGGTYNNAVMGTPSVIGGTANFATYQVGGSAGVSGSIVYLKTTAPTFGTLSFIGGLITAFS